MSSNSKICRYCGVLLNNPSSLKQHESRHKGKGPYKCCGKPFFSKANLKRHRCSNHGEPKDFKCTTCQKSYPTNTDLQRHIRAEKSSGQLAVIYVIKGSLPKQNKMIIWTDIVAIKYILVKYVAVRLDIKPT